MSASDRSEKGGNRLENGEVKSAEKTNWGGNMPQRTRFKSEIIFVSDLVSQLTKQQKEKLISGYDLKKLARIFEDSDMMTTVDNFLKYGMNVSEVSRRLYMHRNTLIYRLNKIRQVTGLDIREFNMAVTFEVLRNLYELK